MDASPTTLDQLKKEVLEKLTGSLLDNLEQGIFLEEEGAEIARFILSETKKVTTNETLLHFLEDLGKRWLLLKETTDGLTAMIGTQQMEKKTVVEDQQKIESIKNQLAQLANRTK